MRPVHNAHADTHFSCTPPSPQPLPNPSLSLSLNDDAAAEPPTSQWGGTIANLGPPTNTAATVVATHMEVDHVIVAESQFQREFELADYVWVAADDREEHAVILAVDESLGKVVHC